MPSHRNTALHLLERTAYQIEQLQVDQVFTGCSTIQIDEKHPQALSDLTFYSLRRLRKRKRLFGVCVDQDGQMHIVHIANLANLPKPRLASLTDVFAEFNTQMNVKAWLMLAAASDEIAQSILQDRLVEG